MLVVRCGFMQKILIVDDDQESRELLAEVLATNRFQPIAVEGVMEAREILRRETDCRIIVADLQMPGESGLEFLRGLRKENLKHEVILMSSFISQAEARAAWSLGVHALLDKPFPLERLLQLIEELAAQGSSSVAANAVTI